MEGWSSTNFHGPMIFVKSRVPDKQLRLIGSGPSHHRNPLIFLFDEMLSLCFTSGEKRQQWQLLWRKIDTCIPLVLWSLYYKTYFFTCLRDGRCITLIESTDSFFGLVFGMIVTHSYPCFSFSCLGKFFRPQKKKTTTPEWPWFR